MEAADGASPEGGRVVAFEGGRCSTAAGAGRAAGAYPDNKVRTSKYTWATFVPLNLFEQMHKFGNIYFLGISALMYLGQHSSLFVGTINYLSTLGVLLMMMAVTGVMALLDDIKRGKADGEVNSRPAVFVDDAHEKRTKKWEDVRVGDLLVVSKDEELPADIVILYSAGDEGTCYVSTANLDGENNLKLKSALPATQRQLGGAGGAQVLHSLGSLTGSVEAEAPQASIYDFKGVLRLESAPAGGRAAADDPLQGSQLLLRGTMLRITDWVLGVVVYTGMQTRMVMNSKKTPPMKRSNTEAVTNTVMLIVLCVQGLLAVISDAMFLSNKEALHSHWYLHFPHLILPDAVAYWLTFVVLYSNLMPISLYPSLELCTAAQTYFIRNDAHMYYRSLRLPAGVRSSNLTDELGQVSFVFSDKTGTLTQNVMELKRVSVAGKTFGTLEGAKGFNGKDELLKALNSGRSSGRMSLFGGWGAGGSPPPPSKQIADFFEVMAVAHTAMAIEGPGGQPSYEAESPDEAALVDAAARVGWTFTGRVGQTMTVSVGARGGKEEKYKVLAVNAFDSTRKRMSVVVEHRGAFHLLVKGADNAMLERMTSRQDALEEHLTEFAKEGLRTLVFARRHLSADAKSSWLRKYEAAQRSMADREGALADAADEIERHLDVVGATAIEDKLQDGVRETITDIKSAGIKLWVLTGDKLETARSIGLSSGVLTAETYVEILDAPIQPHEVGKLLFELECRASQADAPPCALMVTGGAFSVLQASQILMDEFVQHAAKLCSVVIACRISPAQKAEVVRLVRRGVKPQPVTLAIGDGANDVPMIQEAQIGVGVAGLEGCQAVNSSDFSVGQFRYLRRLLLVHGRWNYRRLCRVTLFTFWRNAVQVLLIFFYTLVSGFSGTSLFEDFIRMAFNPLGSIPIVATGVFDQDVDDAALLHHPHLYDVGRTGRDLNVVQMVAAMLNAVVHSVTIWGVALLAVPHMDLHGAGDYYTFGTAVYSVMMVDLFIRVAFLSYTRNRFTVGAIMLSLVSYILYLLVYPCTRLVAGVLSPNMYMVPYHMASNLPFWLCITVAPALNWLLDMCADFLWRALDPREAELSSLRQKSFKDRAAQAGPEKAEETHALIPGDEGGAGLDSGDPHCMQSSRLAGQRYYGWVPPETGWLLVSGLLLVAGTLLLGVGGWSYVAARETRQVRIVYEGIDGWDPAGADALSAVFEGQDECQGGGDCTINVSVPHRMRSPIHVYYAVSPFYQNFNDYLKSEVSKELRGLSVSPSEREAKCIEPTRVNGTEEIVPCGMKAASFFNDTFEFEGMSLDTGDVAWASDLERFHNPPDYPGRPNTSWLFNRYPGVVTRPEGVENRHFIAWMRPAALSSVWKRYGELNGSLEAGAELRVRIRSNFNVKEFGGSKQLVLTEVGALGGHSYELSYLLLGSDAGCLLLAVVVVLVGLSGRVLSKRTDTSAATTELS